MMNNVISKDTPLALMTLGQLALFLGIKEGGSSDNEARTKEETIAGKSFVYGLKGIQDLFHVSHTTAQVYKDGILKDAVFQSGRKIVVDVDKAMQLFNESKRR